MCGITGIVAFNDNGKRFFDKIENSVQTLSKRGPDANGIFRHNNITLAHARLSVIDTSEAANQPFSDPSGRYTIIYNGEFYNYKEHRKALENEGTQFRTTSDTEVLLHLYIKEKEKCLEKINGFFAFAIYDKEEETLFIARDRFGIKPLLIYRDEDKLIFASEMKALLAFGIAKKMDETSLYTYLQLNYIPAPHTILEGVKKMETGNYLKLEIRNQKLETRNYYQIPSKHPASGIQYEEAQKQLIELLEKSVQDRLMSDVPLGCFLSGGIDSSVITALATRHTKNLNTFSIGYSDEPFFDETKYAELVAKKYSTNHTVFRLSNDDLFENLHKVLNYIDEPFADSSAIAVNILSQHTRKQVTVALSGDGGDELFAGYNKHMAEWKARNSGMAEHLIKAGSPIWKNLPQSRNTKFGNLARQLSRFSDGMKLSAKERYWRWATFLNEKEVDDFLTSNFTNYHIEYQKRKSDILQHIDEKGDFNEVLYTDMNLVLQNDMLTKVDSMSMANSLEVRVPFLDHSVVSFAFSLPSKFKINGHIKKRILQDAFRSMLPEEIYNRPKHGFEVPLLKWFQTELKSTITDDLLEDNFIKEQGIFNVGATKTLKHKLFSKNPGDSHATIWALIVFQNWWKKYIYE